MKQNKNGFINDRTYWETFYAHRREPFEASQFARYVLARYLHSGDMVTELGCGNGRDAIYFARHGLQVLAIDQCAEEIEYLSRNYGRDGFRFFCQDFTQLSVDLQCKNVYSRFTLHSISKHREEAVFAWMSAALDWGGHFFLEARGKKNELYGKGKAVPTEDHAFIHDGHYRRFLDLDETCERLNGVGLQIVEAIEATGFAPFNGSDEHFIRIVARRSQNGEGYCRK